MKKLNSPGVQSSCRHSHRRTRFCSQTCGLAAKHAGAVSEVVGVGPAAGAALHASDGLGATAVFRPVIEFFPDGFPNIGLIWLQVGACLRAT